MKARTAALIAEWEAEPLGRYFTRLWYGYEWCHLFADASEELHAFAERIGLKRSWVQRPETKWEHYDLTPQKRAQAVKAGAQQQRRGTHPAS
jgi:hypothetical protein